MMNDIYYLSCDRIFSSLIPLKPAMEERKKRTILAYIFFGVFFVDKAFFSTNRKEKKWL
jgi:hypothetical protein